MERDASPVRPAPAHRSPAFRVADALRRCAPWKCLPPALAPLIRPHLHESGLVEELECRANEMQAQFDAWLAGRLLSGPFASFNDTLTLPGLRPERMDLLPLRELMREATYAPCESLRVLHPRRRHLWCWYEYVQLFMPDARVQCGHCLMLAMEALDAPTADEVWELADTADDRTVQGFGGQRVELADLADPEAHDFGDDPPYFPALSYNNMDEFCWRFFISDCRLCGYRVAPCTAACQCHCLACHYFLHVLNELVKAV